MAASYCTGADLSEILLQAYLDKAEELSPGIIARAVSSANAKVEDALRPVYVLPLATVPDTLRQISATLAAHQVVGAITSLLNESDFAYLLDQVREARKRLDRIRDGRDDLGLDRLGAKSVSDSSVAVITPSPPPRGIRSPSPSSAS